jgi:hypothetical protein
VEDGTEVIADENEDSSRKWFYLCIKIPNTNKATPGDFTSAVATFDHALEQGWEPYAVSIEWNDRIHHLRKRA